MGRISFVAWLFIAAIACLVIAAADFSPGWLIGGIVLLSVAIYALRQLKKEEETGHKGVSVSFFGMAMLVMIATMFLLFWLQFSA